MRGVPSTLNNCKHSYWMRHFNRGRFLQRAAAKLSRICGGFALCTSFACTTNQTPSASSGAPNRHDTLTLKLPSRRRCCFFTFNSGGGANIRFGRSRRILGLSTCATSGSSGPVALHRTNTSSFSSLSIDPGRHVASWSRTQQTLSSSTSVGDARALSRRTDGSSSSASPDLTRASLNERLTANASPWQSTSDRCLASSVRLHDSNRVLFNFSRKHWMTSGGRTSKSGHVTNISMGFPVTSLTNTRAGPAAGGTGRFGGVAAAMATLGARGGAAALRWTTEPRRRRGQRLWACCSFFWGSAIFLLFLPWPRGGAPAAEASGGRAIRLGLPNTCTVA